MSKYLIFAVVLSFCAISIAAVTSAQVTDQTVVQTKIVEDKSFQVLDVKGFPTSYSVEELNLIELRKINESLKNIQYYLWLKR